MRLIQAFRFAAIGTLMGTFVPGIAFADLYKKTASRDKVTIEAFPSVNNEGVGVSVGIKLTNDDESMGRRVTGRIQLKSGDEVVTDCDFEVDLGPGGVHAPGEDFKCSGSFDDVVLVIANVERLSPPPPPAPEPEPEPDPSEPLRRDEGGE